MVVSDNQLNHLVNGADPAHIQTIAFAFDIDGVLVRGKEPLPGARETLSFLQSHNIPFIFLTNGGGLTEAAHVERLGMRLGLNFDEQQFVQSHTPFHDLVPLYRTKTILAIGGHGDQIRDLAHAYGFRDVVTPSDLMHDYEHIHPFPEMTRDHHTAHGRPRATTSAGLPPLPPTTEAAAIFVWSSPRDWCLDLQVITDLLLSHRGRLGTVSPLCGRADLPNCGYQQDGQPLVYFSNPDLEWATPHTHPRLAQGAFREALRGVWAAKTGGRAELLTVDCGKPTSTTFECGERRLQEWHRRVSGAGAPKIATVYMVGDNPESDIRGAKAHRSKFGAMWKSVLVESGVYVAGSEPAHVPDHVARGVNDAVDWALRQEGIIGESVFQDGAFVAPE